eukprot:2087826-Prymnesium_polylepis.1
MGFIIHPTPPPSWTTVFGIRFGPSLNSTTCSVLAKSSWCSGRWKHSSVSCSVRGHRRNL